MKSEKVKPSQTSSEKVLGCGVGFESPTQKYCRRRLARSGASRLLLIFSLVALPLSPTGRGRAPSPLPPTEVVENRPHFRNQRKKDTDWVSFTLVAEVGFEPHDLRVMSPTSYQAALLRDILSLGGAGDRDRTGTILSYHGILSPGRLPVPPHRRLQFPVGYFMYYTTQFLACQPFF